MALTVTTDLTVLSTAESVTNWVSYGAGGAGGMAIEPDFFVQGSNCISRGVSGVATQKGMCYNHAAGINFTSGADKDKLVYIWVRTSTPGLCDTRAAGGIRIILGSGTTAPGDALGVWSAWYVDGSDSIIATEGWICYVIDSQSTPSTTYGGGVNLAAVTYLGAVMRSTATAKGQNFGVDQVAYGRGEIYVSGTVATAGAGFKEIADVVYDSARTNRWGVITVKQGVYFVKGKIIIGHGSSDTTFSSYNESVIWETPGYYNGTNVVQAIPDASVGGTTGADGLTTYNGLAFRGGSGTTATDFGIIAGTDNGRSGSTFNCPINNGLTTPARTTAWVSASDSAMTLSIYNSKFTSFIGGVDLYGTNLSGDDCFGNTFDACGQVDSNMEIRNCNFLNTTVTTGAFLWRDSVSNATKSGFINNARGIQHPAAAGSPYTYNALLFSGNTYDINNSSGSAIVVNKTNNADPSTYTGSAVTFNEVKTLTITCKNESGLAVASARVRIEKQSDKSLITNGETDANGVYQITDYNYTGVMPVNIITRKKGYKNSAALDSITANGLSVPFTMIADATVNLP